MQLGAAVYAERIRTVRFGIDAFFFSVENIVRADKDQPRIRLLCGKRDITGANELIIYVVSGSRSA
ncbi:hypothetical protein ABB08_01700 [Paenibacillus larvae]|nr:hypothetical protein [Paenibacillus larvae]